MNKKFTNKEIANLLRNVSAAHQVKGENYFQIRAYDLAAEAIENAGSDVKTLWEEGHLDKISGIGSNIANYLDELLSTGKVNHFEKTFEDLPKSMFELLEISGVGPKTAFKFAEAGVKNIPDLEEKIKLKTLLKKGFGQKTLAKVALGIGEYRRRSDRILLPTALVVAKEVIDHLKKHKDVVLADPLGSLRRKVSTVGDVDISVATNNPKSVIEHFTKYPEVDRVVESGDKTATITTRNAIRVDLMTQPPEQYGTLLHHFTGSKAHNIHMRKIAKEKGYSISEHGIKELKNGKLIKIEAESDVYSFLKMQTPPPEIREDIGEIEAAQKDELPRLVELEDIRGDLHTHSFWTDGQDSIADMAKAAKDLGREYIGLTDHSYPNLKYKSRLEEIEQFNYSQDDIRVISGLEVNINADSTLQISNDILADHDIILVSIHTSFRQTRQEMTKRIITAMENPEVNILAHPTGRLLLEREGIDADWEKIFRRISELGKFIEIDGFPNRLDLPDNLVQKAKKFGIKFSVDTDSHHTNHLKLMEYGVAVARRGWLEKQDVINTLPYAKLRDILRSKN